MFYIVLGIRRREGGNFNRTTIEFQPLSDKEIVELEIAADTEEYILVLLDPEHGILGHNSNATVNVTPVGGLNIPFVYTLIRRNYTSNQILGGVV